MEVLTKTENKVAHLVAQGNLHKEIASKMYVSEHTVHAHLRNIRKKLNAGNIADITRMYILSLDNPRQVLRAVFFLVIQLGIIASDVHIELRRPINARVKLAKGKGM